MQNNQVNQTNKVPRLFQPKNLKVKKPAPELTQADWQVIQKVLESNLNQLEIDQEWVESMSSRIWEDCDRTNPETQFSFQQLKKVLNIRDDLKAKKVKLGALQNKVKKIAKGSV